MNPGALTFSSSQLRCAHRWRASAKSATLFALLTALFTSVTVLQPVRATEVDARAIDQHGLSSAALADTHVRHLLGPGEATVVSVDRQVDKAEAIDYLDGKTDKAPGVQATVLLWNRHTGQAVRALLSAATVRVLSVEPVKAVDVPLIPEEIDEALALAKASSVMQKAVGESLSRYQLVRSGEDDGKPLRALALPVRGIDPKDPCTAGRCLDLLFRGEQGYLGLRAQVNLSRRAVTVVRAVMHEETHR